MTGPTKGNARRQPGEATNQKDQQTNYSRMSTATEAQLQRVLALLRTGPKTSYDLRERGNIISTDRTTLTDRDGYQHRGCAEYSLLREVLPC